MAWQTVAQRLNILVLAASLAGLTNAAFATVLEVTIDTTNLAGTPAQIALDFIDGGAPANSMTVSGFATDGSLGAQTPTRDVTGSLPGDVTLTDADFYNELLANITLGTSISFLFTPTSNLPDPRSVPDAFSVFLLDPVSGLPLFPTTDPSGADALFQFDIDGTELGALRVFDAPGGEVALSVTPVQQQVPEPGTALLIALGLVGAFFARQPATSLTGRRHLAPQR